MAITYVLRYKTETQKKKLEKIAKQCGRSANSHILYLIDKELSNQPKSAKTTTT